MNLVSKQPTSQKVSDPENSSLRFTPLAWAKLLYLRDRGPTEVGGFGIAETDDPLLITDLQLIDQECSAISVVFDDQAVAQFFDQQVDRGLRPAQFARVWIHTHPGKSPAPSVTDEETFARVFGRTEWAVMFILARRGKTFCRLQFHVGPGGAIELPVQVDYTRPFGASDHAAWDAEYLAKVRTVAEPWLYEDLSTRCESPSNRTESAHAVDGDDRGTEEFDFEEAWYDLY